MHVNEGMAWHFIEDETETRSRNQSQELGTYIAVRPSMARRIVI